jgi:cob(I)alamin adenosyltransferase
MRIYTKTGDGGETGLFGGPRVPKDSPRIEACGAVDELNALVGLARADALPAEIDELLARVQSELFDLGAQLATPDPAVHGTALIGPARIASLEAAIDRFDATLEPLRQFILPGGTRGAAALHVARAVCRRAERRIVTFSRTPGNHVCGDLTVYLNRLGDLLFVLARATNSAAGQPDVPWTKQG